MVTLASVRVVSGVRPAAAAVVVGGVVAAGAVAGPVALGLSVVVLQACLLSGWHQLLRVPGAFGGSVVALGAGIAAVLVLEIDAAASAIDDVGRLAPVLAFGLIASFGHQVMRRDGRTRVVASLSATAALVVGAVLPALWVATLRSAGLAVVLLGLAGAVIAAVAAAIVPRGGWPLSVVAGAGAALVVGTAAGVRNGTVFDVVLLSLGAAGPAVIAAHLRGLTGRAARTAPATLAALPCALAALPIWVLARVLLG
jgi:hypothetical protein